MQVKGNFVTLDKENAQDKEIFDKLEKADVLKVEVEKLILQMKQKEAERIRIGNQAYYRVMDFLVNEQNIDAADISIDTNTKKITYVTTKELQKKQKQSEKTQSRIIT